MFNASKINEYPTIADLFGLLDGWRHLPDYQLERRADVFFALFLPEVLEEVLSKDSSIVKIRRPLIPEFPIRTDKKDKNGKNYNSSKKVDYFALSEDGRNAFLIELKTDMQSIDEGQIDFIKSTAQKGIAEIIWGVLEILQATKGRAKYVHLLSNLSQLGLVKHKDERVLSEPFLGQLHKNAIPVDRCRTGWKGESIRQGREFMEMIRNVKPAKTSLKVRVIYIQPKPKDSDLIPCDWHRIYFDRFADHAKERGSIGRRFAESLRAWKEPAGSCPPQS